MTDTTPAPPPVENGADAAQSASLDIAWLTVPDVGEELGIDVMKVRQLIRERQVLAVRRDGVLYIPADFVQEGRVTKGLPGVLTLLSDARYSEAEMLDWLYRADDSLPGTPIQALRENRGTEVKRRAQAVGF